ncbi:hypothetical protein BC940DRAFT_249973 [Gongronella butleri]|nr:hypothetical protein BC940DRAFT_249973 [Gongronella butleri]
MSDLTASSATVPQPPTRVSAPVPKDDGPSSGKGKGKGKAPASTVDGGDGPEQDKKKRAPRPRKKKPAVNGAPGAAPAADDADKKTKPAPKRPPRKKKSKQDVAQGDAAPSADSKVNGKDKKEPKDKKETKDKGKGKKDANKPRFNKNRAQGQLTSAENDNTSSSPGQAVPNGPHRTRQPRRTGGKPVADDMASTMAHELTTGAYECMVCWDTVKPFHHTWSCENCWAIFHTDCISKWASKSLKDTSTNLNITAWRCPGCQHKRTAIPQGYFCFCGKQQNPQASRYQTPHTCDQLCKRSRKCPHPCTLPCHPGPCPPCTSMGPVTVCFCGKERRQAKCVDTDYDTNAYSCGTICDERMGCGEHQCKEPCHPGLCPPCQVVDVQQDCYCGQSHRSATCGDGLPFSSSNGHLGYYACEKQCTRLYDCGIHQCDQGCHPCQASSSCPYSPENIKTCPCGAAKMEDLAAPRTSCQDPIATCGGICYKTLPCGHTCQQPCHRGACRPCELNVKVGCQCGATEYDAICGQDAPVRTCDRVCKAMRNCGRHACRQTCCPAAKTKAKKRVFSASALAQAERAHDCPLTCERQLSCGKHQCQQPCHKGPCPPCLEATFDEVACHCGRTRLEPPVRCGTKLPPCPHPCQRALPCGHLRLLQHNCHPDDEPCPPCPVLISRQCECGKTELKNIPCFRAAAHCGTVCGKPLACGQHQCQRTCHRGDCVNDDNNACTQRCQRMRDACGHPCLELCHGDDPCPQTNPCQARIKASCACGQHAMEIPCQSTAESSGNSDTLQCNDFCAKIERNRRLAAALDISKPDLVKDALGQHTAIDALSTDEVPFLSLDDLGYYDTDIRDFFTQNRSWAMNVEKQLIAFAKDSDTPIYHFKPMRPLFRRFIHRYAIHFNVAAEALDPEPQRSVCLRKTLGNPRIPPILLSKAIHDPSLMAPPPAASPSAVANASSSLTAAAIVASSTPSPSPAPQTSDNDDDTLVVTSAAIGIASRQPVNALQVTGLTFGILEEDLDRILIPLINAPYDVHWGQEATDCVIAPNYAQIIDDMEMRETRIWDLKKTLQNALFTHNMAAHVACCWINQAAHVTWTEKQQHRPSNSPNANSPAQQNRFDLLDEHQE